MKISQREARRLRQRVRELEERERVRLNAWGSSYTPGSVHAVTLQLPDWARERLWMAKQLGYVLVCKYNDERELRVFAVPKEH